MFFMRAIEDRASSAFCANRIRNWHLESREMCAIRLRARRWPHAIRSRYRSGTSRTNRTHSTGGCSWRQVRMAYASRLNQREDRLHRIWLVLNPRRKTVRSARSNDGVENNRRSFSVKKYESFISQGRQAESFCSLTFVIAGGPQPGGHAAILSIVGSRCAQAKGPRDGDIDLASVTCLVQFNRIEIMECKLYVRIFQFVSANESGRKESVAEPINPIESLPTLPWAASLAVRTAVSDT